MKKIVMLIGLIIILSSSISFATTVTRIAHDGEFLTYNDYTGVIICLPVEDICYYEDILDTGGEIIRGAWIPSENIGITELSGISTNEDVNRPPYGIVDEHILSVTTSTEEFDNENDYQDWIDSK